MNLIKTSWYSVVATALKLSSALVVNKALSVFIGPSGLVVVAQFQNFTQIALTIAQAGINNGVVRYSSEYRKCNSKFSSILTSGLQISLVSSVLVALFCVLFSDLISSKLFLTTTYSYIISVYGLLLIFFVSNGFVLSVLTGLKKVDIWFRISALQSIYSLLMTSVLIYFYGIDGALVALASNQALIFLFLIPLSLRHISFNFDAFFKEVSRENIHKLSSYSAMAVGTAVCVPTSLFLVRSMLVDSVGITQAGYWQAAWYLSSVVLMFITSIISLYFLPRFSELQNSQEVLDELSAGLKVIMPISATLFLMLFFSRYWIIPIIFSTDFLPVSEIFGFQLIGDFLKIIGTILGFILVSRAKVGQFLMLELIWSVIFVGCSWLFLPSLGLLSAVSSYVVSTAAYTLLVGLMAVRLLYISSES